MDFVDWLIGGHIHFIITHVHQGMESFGWGVEELYDELQRLQWHPGFPKGKELRCPVFTQNKMKYIKALAGMTMPTFDINISHAINDDGVKAKIEEVMSKSCNATAWILKAPYTTNSQNYKNYVNNALEACSAMNR